MKCHIWYWKLNSYQIGIIKDSCLSSNQLKNMIESWYHDTNGFFETKLSDEAEGFGAPWSKMLPQLRIQIIPKSSDVQQCN